MKIINPIGQDTYKGLSVPLYGESVIRQNNSSNAALTLMHSTANTGRFLMGLDYKNLGSDIASSVLTDLAVFDIDADGGFRCVSGTTVNYELNTTGLLAATSKVITSSGEVTNYNLKTVVAMTTGADYSPVSSQSGTIFQSLGDGNGTSMAVLLPKNPPAGTFYEFFISSQDGTGDFVISCTANSSAKLILPGATSVASTVKAIQPGTTLCNHYIRLVALSSVRWFCWPSFGTRTPTATTEHQLTDLNLGHWTSASTA